MKGSDDVTNLVSRLRAKTVVAVGWQQLSEHTPVQLSFKPSGEGPLLN